MGPKPGLRADPGTRFQPVPFDEVGGKSGGSNGLLHDLANPNDSPGPFSPGGPSTPENEGRHVRQPRRHRRPAALVRPRRQARRPRRQPERLARTVKVGGSVYWAHMFFIVLHL